MSWSQDTQLWLVSGVIVLAMILFVWERFRPDLTALLLLVLLGVLGLIPANRLFSGFSSGAVISIMSTMIMGAGLDRAGVLHRLAGWLLRASKGVDEYLVLLLTGTAGSLSSVMQNPAVTALYLPIVSRLSARTGVNSGRMLLPLGLAALLGGNLTMVGSSPLIMLNDLMMASNANLPANVAQLNEFSMFAPLPIGLCLLCLGMAYFYFFGRKLFAGAEGRNVVPGRTESYFSETYGIHGDVHELTVSADSPLVGMNTGELEALPDAPLLLAVKEGEQMILAPVSDTRLWGGSVLAMLAPRKQVAAFAKTHQLRVHSRMRRFTDLFNPSRSGICEAVVPPSSKFIGRTIRELGLRSQWQISVLAVNRNGDIFRDDLRSFALKAGDMLVLHCIWRKLIPATRRKDMVVVTDYPKEEQRPHKMFLAMGTFAVSLALALTHVVPVPVALLMGVLGMVFGGVLKMDEAYQAIQWKTVFLMACLIPLGWAVEDSGLAALVAEQTVANVRGLPLFVILLLLGLMTTFFALVISHIGATVMMVPMAINIAVLQGESPMAFALMCALAASNNLISSSNPVLAMVSGPGGYRGKDLLRVGLPLSLMFLVVSALGVMWLF